ncbi:MAG TPA: c-type cytochrome [Azoarcus taiwanensis]|nr:c-type cytochrome [Azoarcus taiwanensis]
MKVFVTAAVALGVLTVAPAFASQELASAKNCMACHAVDRQLVGPSYQAVAEKRGGEENAVAYLAEKIQKGGSGVYGPVPMPPNPQVSAEEAVTLAEWVLSFK